MQMEEKSMLLHAWDQVYSLSVYIWPLLTRNRGSAGIDLVKPHRTSSMYLFSSDLLVGVDLHMGNLVESQVFFPNSGIGNSYSSTDVCPHLSVQKFIRKVRKDFNKMAKYLKRHMRVS